jgi:hypothetical protein
MPPCLFGAMKRATPNPGNFCLTSTSASTSLNRLLTVLSRLFDLINFAIPKALVLTSFVNRVPLTFLAPYVSIFQFCLLIIDVCGARLSLFV